jgi:hypothetical protein
MGREALLTGKYLSTLRSLDCWTVKVVTLGFIIIYQVTVRNIAGDSNYSPSPLSELDISQRIGEPEDWFDLVEDFCKHRDLLATFIELWVFFC